MLYTFADPQVVNVITADVPLLLEWPQVGAVDSAHSPVALYLSFLYRPTQKSRD